MFRQPSAVENNLISIPLKLTWRMQLLELVNFIEFHKLAYVLTVSPQILTLVFKHGLCLLSSILLQRRLNLLSKLMWCELYDSNYYLFIGLVCIFHSNL